MNITFYHEIHTFACWSCIRLVVILSNIYLYDEMVIRVTAQSQVKVLRVVWLKFLACELVTTLPFPDEVMTWKPFHVTCQRWKKKSLVTGCFCWQRACCEPEGAVEQTVRLTMLWNIMTPMWNHCDVGIDIQLTAINTEWGFSSLPNFQILDNSFLGC